MGIEVNNRDRAIDFRQALQDGQDLTKRSQIGSLTDREHAHNGMVPSESHHPRMILSIQTFGVTQILHSLRRYYLSRQEGRVGSSNLVDGNRRIVGDHRDIATIELQLAVNWDQPSLLSVDGPLLTTDSLPS